MSTPNFVHPTAIIGDAVRMGSGNVIGPNVVITGDVVLGDDNWVGPNTCIGIEGDLFGIPSVSTTDWWTDGRTSATFGVRLGSRNVLKEGVTIHAGSHRHTTIGDDAYLMPRSHLGHDCWLGDNVTMSPNAQIAGHVAIGTRAVIGMGALVHQFSAIGPVVMVGMGAVVREEVPPARTVVGDPLQVSGINRVGLSRLLGAEPDREALRALRSPDTWGELPERLAAVIGQWQVNIARRDH